MIKSIANSFGDELSYTSQTPGGATFQIHANNLTTYSNIDLNAWDFVVLQAQSQEPSFPDSQVDQNTIPYAIQIADSVYANYFCSDVNMFMTWGRKDGDPQWGPISTFEGMNGRLRAAYMRMADSVQGSVTPVGSAWAYIRENYPSLGDSLYVSDGSHPSIIGSYLAACTFYASLYRKNPTGSSYVAGLSGTQAAIIQQAAAMTVLDSLDQWNLRPIEEHTQAEFLFTANGNNVDFTNLSTKAESFNWDFGDGNNSVNIQPSNSYVSSGTYQIQLIAQSTCDSDTTQQSITLGNADLEEILFSAIGGGSYTFSISGGIDQLYLFSSDGKQVEFKLNQNTIDLSKEPNGVYFVVLRSNETFYCSKLSHIKD